MSYFLPSSGEMAGLIRSRDWADSELGPIASWPRGLKIALRIMLDSRYAMWLGWGDGLRFFYNDAYAAMTLGPKHPWALGKRADEVWSEIWPEIGPRAEAVLRDGVATWDEGLLLFLRRSGFDEETYHTFSYSPLPGDAGDIGGLLCVVTEETQRVLSERQLRTLRELSAATAGAKSARAACDLAAGSLGTNPFDLPFVLVYLAEDAGPKLAARVGLPPGSAVTPEAAEGSPWPFADAAAGPVVVEDFAARFGTIHAGPWGDAVGRAVVVPLGPNAATGYFVAGLSARRAYEESYRGFLSLIADRLVAAVSEARAFEEEKRRAEALAELDRAKTTFFGNVSHEFRTPLTLLLAPVEEILAKPDGDVLPDNRALLGVVHRNALRLQKLVNTLLDFSRIEAGRIEARFRPTDLAALTADLAGNFRSACERAGLRLEVDCRPLPEPVYVDHDMYEKIVLNLVNNAFKFTLAGTIAVRLRSDRAAATLDVSDTGVGIAAPHLSRLFERFYRVEGSAGRSQEGTGIGLALIRELARLHGGDVTAASEAGRGSTFTVRLPLGSAHLPPDRLAPAAEAVGAVAASPFVREVMGWLPDAPDDDAGVAPPAPEDAPRVLLADDNADMRGYVRRLLSSGYAVTAVADGLAALDALRAGRFDLLLTDIMMPRLDGFGLLGEVRADPDLRGLPVILLSARAGEEARVEGLEAGADDYLTKPFGAKELLARVASCLSLAAVRRRADDLVRASEERLRLAVEATGIGIVDYDPVAGVNHWSDEALRIWGFPAGHAPTPDEVWARIHADDVAEARRRTLASLDPDGPGTFHTEHRVERPDGDTRWVSLRGKTEFAGSGGVVRAVRSVGTMLDVTEQKRAEDAIREADRRKEVFLATLAHELRNPLAPIRNGLQVLRRADNPAAAAKARDMMERQLNHLVRLVDDLLDVSRISRGKLEVKPAAVPLGAVIESAVETGRPLLDAAGVRLELDVAAADAVLLADLTRLSQVFGNLLSNAAKFTPAGGTVTVSARAEGGAAVVSVRDTGAGIPAGDLGHIFDMFSQVDRPLEKTTGGLGIGLALVRGLVGLHGGTVEASSDGPDRGSTFVVRLPVSSDAPAVPAPQAAPAEEVCMKRVLIVDDNADAAASLAMLVELLGNETRTAADGLQGIEAAEAYRPDLVIMDIGMPRLNGYDACRRIRATPWGKTVRMAALTGWGSEEDRRKAREAGFDHHMVKPVDPDALEEVLRSLGADDGRA